MSSKSSLLLALSFFFGVTAIASAGRIEQKTFTVKSYPGSRDRQYKVFVPSSYTGQSAVPMVMVLHGCRQNNDDMINDTRFKDLAERDNFIVVYPFITSVAQSDGLRSPNCWGFFLDQHIHKGAGEVEDLYQIALEVESAFKIDPQHRYVTGLSSGGGMAVDLAVARSEYFAAAGSVEGLPYSETANSVTFFGCTPGTFEAVSADVTAMQAEQRSPEEQRLIPIMAIHARNDCVVNRLGSDNIRDSWIRRYGVNKTAVATTDCAAQGVACTQTMYGLPQRSAVETVFYDSDPNINRGHYWVGDNRGQFADPRGPSASELLWAFFKSHPFTNNPPPSVSIASALPSGTSITVTGSASASAGSIVEVAVRLHGKFPQPQKIASGTSAWTVAFDSLPNNVRYVPVATAKDNNGVTASVTGAAVAVGSVPPNLPPVVSIDDVSVSGNCVTLKGTTSDPDDQVAKVEVQLGARGFKPAAFSQTSYQYQECGLAGGTYPTQAQATDSLGAKSAIVSGQSVDVIDVEVVTANWQAHMSAGRLRVYGPPCQSVGFGACDAGFSEIFLANQFNPFPLHRKASPPNWYVHRENIP